MHGFVAMENSSFTECAPQKWMDEGRYERNKKYMDVLLWSTLAPQDALHRNDAPKKWMDEAREERCEK